ncbi:MAG: hypothetical protein VKL60_22345 [Sphaerospermopsis sp.]|jgi:hypothetical protein|uniref:Uncharacterized protein n=1 Tax=Sphaerospermopsis aphanizomenoides LEGE 00250 TaxID=2777972 RepID=A0ABR9VJ92_9CYAN|nr:MULTISPECIES: hypothetical protein [Aphanizomenonaceae]MBC5796559.1 hypothetical protein [Sphaerospermopsis sp. LEGE 00249]MBD2444097.1 hypothetical protein [Dolichospermum sp. FACHB-1091]MBE9237737.1 hypothetical protein [Sphaerospermopsis aphanizomenoides LEGE 00250]MEB3151743.1 hypothetical protein [Sphaerospermopsis sp.]
MIVKKFEISDSVAEFLRSDYFNKIPRVDDKEVEFAKYLGIDIKNYPKGVAYIVIQNYIDLVFDNFDDRFPTEKQINFLSQFGIDVSYEKRFVVDAVIESTMTILNLNTIETENLKHGSKVFHINNPEKILIISSISEDGIVYFKGGNGQKAYARNLKTIKE